MSDDLSKKWSRVVGRAYIIEGATDRIRVGVAEAIKKYADETLRKAVEVRTDGDQIAVAVSKGQYGMITTKGDRPGIHIRDIQFSDIVEEVEGNAVAEPIDLAVSAFAPRASKGEVRGLPQFSRIVCSELDFGSP